MNNYAPWVLLVTYCIILFTFAVLMTNLWWSMRRNMFFYNDVYKAIDPIKILIFFLLTFIYLIVQIWLVTKFTVQMQPKDGSCNGNNTTEIVFLKGNLVLINIYCAASWSNIIFYFVLHFNPVNLVLKYIIINFELFTQIAIEVQKYLNTRIYEINIPNKDENYQLRYYSYITNTTETDKGILREMFIPTKAELERN